MKKATSLLAAALVALSGMAASADALVLDGALDATYGPAKAEQRTQTQFGNSNLGAVDFANGSELDNAYGVIMNDTLWVFLGGNLESNFNKLDVFIDSRPGGQPKLQGNNPDVDFNGLNRMGDDGSGNGLIFDQPFASDYYFTMTGGNSPYESFASFAPTDGSGGFGTFVGGGPGRIHPGGALGIGFAINNKNVAGVSGGCDPSSGAGVDTGMEFKIPLKAIGDPSGCILITAFINGSGHDFVSNQVLGPLQPPHCNLGEPRNVDFNTKPGVQYFQVCPSPVPAENTTWGRMKSVYR